jgi:hypothetical protein
VWNPPGGLPRLRINNGGAQVSAYFVARDRNWNGWNWIGLL